QPTPQQLEQFKRMSPAEQSRLAKQFGVEIPQGGGVGQVQTIVQETTVQPRVVDTSLNHKQPQQIITKKEGLMPFGYDLFSGNPTTFTPINDIPVSSDYVLGPGDSLKVNLFGKDSQSYELVIDQEGATYLPDLGPLHLAGQTFSEAKQNISNTINQKMIGVKASVSMGQLRSIRVFVLGEAYLPGSYVVSSLSTMTNALVLSGGVSENGSLREIQLKRKGKLIQTLDVYDLLLKGDTSNDAQLRSGDVVFIPSIGSTVGIKGEVRRAARYELTGDETAESLMHYAGGLLSSAYPQLATLQRIDQNNQRTLLNLNLKQSTDLQTNLKNGDVISIPKVAEKVENIIKLSGHILREESLTWQQGLRLSNVMSEVQRLKPNPDLNYGLIKRYHQPDQKLEVVPFSLENALNQQGSKRDILLQNQDEILFFGLYDSSRQKEIAKLIELLKSQSTIVAPSKEITVSGDVRFPGVYPLSKGMNVSNLISAAGGLTEKAFQLRAELSRTEFNQQQERKQYRVDLNLTNTDSLMFTLKSRDVLQIKTIPEWAESEQVTLSGEVKFPGVYPIYKNDTLAILLERAGGLTEYAYAPGSMFTRVDLKKQQAKQLKEMQERLAEDIAKAELVSVNQGSETKEASDVGVAQKILSQLKGTKATGRLVIDLEKVLAKESDYSIPLQKGDALYIPSKKNSVTIVGEVQLPISQIYEAQLSYWDYIERSGGTTDKADEGRVYIIKANGAVKMPESSTWFASTEKQIAPGDTIVVPLDADKLDQIVLWRDMSQIFYQIALGAAAVGSL
ncbi:SLBB domain-containing protein, partial [uncultured Paraglaciecola sp.]|uniref:polysaccharide biosynthesis/export family protein n=1 Tax=uncultured Paraglaciecola sp. TaxID=1765024 RepID=UPI0025E3ED38